MKKSEMIEALANETGLTKADAEKMFNATFNLVKEELAKGNKVSIAGFGTFKITERAAREGRNPATGEAMTIKASKAPKFKAGKALKDLINE